MPRSLLGFIALGAAVGYALFWVETNTPAEVPIVGKSLIPANGGSALKAMVAGASIGFTAWELRRAAAK